MTTPIELAKRLREVAYFVEQYLIAFPNLPGPIREAAALLDVRDYGWIPIYREYGARKTIIVPFTISESEAYVIGCPVKRYERIVRVAGSFGMPLTAAKGEGQ